MSAELPLNRVFAYLILDMFSKSERSYILSSADGKYLLAIVSVVSLVERET